VLDTSSQAEQANLKHLRSAEIGWLVIWLLGLVAIVVFAAWETVPFYLIWISLAVLYGFRVWPKLPTAMLLAAVAATTTLAIGIDVADGRQDWPALVKVPLIAAMFWAMVWHAHRRLAASAELGELSSSNAELLHAQQAFMQDASHQLRTPITIALGHAELLAAQIASRQQQRDIHVVVGELNRLKQLSERLLMIAAAQGDDFLRLEPVALDRLITESLRRWRAAAPRRWELGKLEHIVVHADRDRLAMALDALLENAVQHTSAGDLIRLSVYSSGEATFACMVVQDTGEGIAAANLASIFDRFATAPGALGPRGTGLGLPLVLAIAHSHGGEVDVVSAPGQGSTFELKLPLAGGLPAGPGVPPPQDGTASPVALGGAVS
jgi:signal transduction histidine kinase